jgi:hypothetical protein
MCHRYRYFDCACAKYQLIILIRTSWPTSSPRTTLPSWTSPPVS